MVFLGLLITIKYSQKKARKPKGSNNPNGNIKELIENKHENYNTFKEHVIEKAMSILDWL